MINMQINALVDTIVVIIIVIGAVILISVGAFLLVGKKRSEVKGSEKETAKEEKLLKSSTNEPTKEEKPQESEVKDSEKETVEEEKPQESKPIKEETDEESEENEVVEKRDEFGNLSFFAYNRSFTARLIQAKVDVQDYYEKIKNHLLSYKGVKSRVSWSYDAFHVGRAKLALIAIKGKTINVYLALSPSDIQSSKYHFDDASKVKKYEETPIRLRIKNDLNLRYCLELIDQMMQKMALTLGEEKALDYHLPYEETDALKEKGLIRLDKVAKPGYQSTEKVVNPVIEETDKESSLSVEETGEEEEEKPEIVEREDAFGHKILYYYNRSFTAKLIQTSKDNQDFYSILKNHLLAYDGVKSRTSWSFDAFHKGRINLSRITIKGKTLNIYLAIDPKKFVDSKYHYLDCSSIKKFEDTPMRLTVRNYLNVKYVSELIDLMMQEKSIDYSGDDQRTDYSLPYEAIEPLLDRGLAKLIEYNKDISSQSEETKEEPKLAETHDEVEAMRKDTVNVSEVDELVSDKAAMNEVETEVAKTGYSHRAIVNLDTISENFKNGDKVTLKVLIEKGLVKKDCDGLKVLARGELSKKLEIVANEFSVEAIKMIILTGGKVTKIIKG